MLAPDFRELPRNKDTVWEATRNTSPNVALAPFEAGEPKQLLIFAYQRTGSTFFGKIFNSDPDVFYVYEPLDGLYNSIYGTQHGWVVPTDIYRFPNGSARTPPDYEVEAVVSTLRRLLSCDIADLPIELLTHEFFHQFLQTSTTSYRTCLMQYHLSDHQCAGKLHRRCLDRFGSNQKTMDMCRSQIARVGSTAAEALSYFASHNLFSSATSRTKTSKGSKGKGRKAKRDIVGITEQSEFSFNDYVRCISAKAHKLQKCLPILTRSCAISTLRVVKIVRGEMRHVDALMRASCNFRLVHLIRDPRGVINSRRQLEVYHSISVNKTNMLPEAYYYCTEVMRDIRLRRQLEAKYPGRIMQVIYDDFVTSAHEQVRQIYASFLQRPIPAGVIAFINTTRPGTASSWKTKHNAAHVHQIEIICKGLYGMLSDSGYIFNHTLDKA